MKLTIQKWGDGYEDSGIITTVETNSEFKSVEFKDGEKEDMYIARDLSGAKRIKDLIVMAYNAGIRNESIEVVEINEEPT